MRGNKTIYILPNLFTTAALFCGFYAILAAVEERFSFAASLVFFAMIFDSFDGRVARWTHTESEFGVQYDSLSDLISFGVAPALIIYENSLYLVAETAWLPTKLGWMSAFVYTACAALRLARFNTQVHVQDNAVFIGLPSPAAAAVLVSFVWVGSNYQYSGQQLLAAALPLTLFCGLMMVSPFKYYSFKTFKLERRIPFRYAAVPAILLGLLFLEFEPTIFILSFIYSLHGPLWSLLRWRKKRK